MRQGFYTNYTEEVAKFAQNVGFRSMELSAWPSSSLNADKVSDQRLAEIMKDLENRDIQISGLGYYPNYLDPDPEVAQETRRYLVKVMDLAVRMGLDTVCTFAGRDPDKSVIDNLPIFKEVFSRFCDEAEKRNVKIAIENCPMMDRFRMRGENIAFSPEIWDEMFRIVPSKSLGLEIDPAHMVWLGIDYVQAIHDFGNKIFHAHAKDTEIMNKVLSRSGILGPAFNIGAGMGQGWWRARTPGWGDVDWTKFVTVLIEVNYKGNVDIEHEDDVFASAGQMGAIVTEDDIVANYGQEEKGLILGLTPSVS